MMNIDPSKLPLHMDIDMNKYYYKYFRHKFSWVIVHSINLNNKLVSFDLHLLRSVKNTPVLAEYGAINNEVV